MRKAYWIYFVVILAIIVLVVFSFALQLTSNGTGKRCLDGFRQIANGCTTDKVSFECTDKIISGKGYSICNHFITNIEAIADYRTLAQSNATLKVNGLEWQSYQFCPTDPNAPMPMTCDAPWTNLEVTSFQIVG